LGLLPDVFEEMTWANYQRLVVYHYKKEADEWDRTRVILSYILNTQVEKKHQKKPKQILPLWIDKIAELEKIERLKKQAKITQEEKEEMLKRVGK
jgi:hypothetical protein